MAPDTFIICEGDLGHRSYVVVDVTVQVVRSGAPVAVLERGGQFAEVALIADVSRTASVVSRTTTRLLATERADFLQAVTRHEPSQAAVMRHAATFIDPDGSVAR